MSYSQGDYAIALILLPEKKKKPRTKKDPNVHTGKYIYLHIPQVSLKGPIQDEILPVSKETKVFCAPFAE